MTGEARRADLDRAPDELRGLIQQACAQRGAADSFDAGWALLEGVDRYDLWRAVTPGIRALLNRPLPDSEVDAEPVSQLMLLAWRASHPTRPCPLDSADQRRRIRTWFDEAGLERYHLQPYLDHDPVVCVERSRQALAKPARTGFGLNLIGYPAALSGQGEDLRLIARQLRAAQIPFSIYRLPHGGDGHWQAADWPELSDTLPYPNSLFCMNFQETGALRQRLGAAAFDNRYNIGLWPLELADLPGAAADQLPLLDEIWAISSFNARAYREAGHPRVYAMPPLMRAPGPAALPRWRAPRPLRLLYVFDAQSYLSRKNPLAAARAFRRAFPLGDENTELLLKVSNPNWRDPIMDKLRRQAAFDRRIRIIDQALDPLDMGRLFDSCDAYLSLHRSEGFGRTIAEAMVRGKLAIATDWSGSQDLVSTDTGLPVRCTLQDIPPGAYPHAENQQWAEPDEEHAAQQIRKLASLDEAERARLGEAARQWVLQRHCSAAAWEHYAQRLQALAAIAPGFRS